MTGDSSDMIAFLLMPRTILVAAAVIPAVFLLVKVYKGDRLEREDPVFVFLLVVMGIISTLSASILEEVGTFVLSLFFTEEDIAYQLLLYYIVVALSEEGSKYVLLRYRTYNSREFNCRYDAVVYAVAVSLGFALWENILYVFRFGLGTALSRAVTAIPGHCSFAVFMGVWYARDKECDLYGEKVGMYISRILSLLIPVLLHGTYDYLCSLNSDKGAAYFLVFIIVMFALSFLTVRNKSRSDGYL